MFFQKYQIDPLYGTLAYEGIADNTGTITKSIDRINRLQYNNTYDSTDRLMNFMIGLILERDIITKEMIMRV